MLLLLLAAASLGRATVSAQSPVHRAAIVARFAEGQNLYRCIEFQEASITGEELLRRTNWNIVMDATTSEGNAVCRINETGCGVEDCFCNCRGDECVFWSYWHWADGDWEYAITGGGGYSVVDGALEGWSWGPGDGQTGTKPPAVTFAEICGAVASNPTPAGNTPEPETARPPDGTFDADEPVVAPGACSILNWVIFDATQVTLNGSPVNAQDRLEVCPATTERYVLVATNGVGQLTREVTVEVRNDALPLPTAQAPGQGQPISAPQPPAAAPQQPVASPVIQQAIAPVATASAEMNLTPIAPAQAAVEVTATPLLRPAATEPPPALALALTALPTPVAIAQAQSGESEDERVTPTPILVALAGDAATGTENAAQSSATAATAFDPALLPGYGAFLLMVSGLLGAAAWIWQRSRIR
jgi:hypothetical protein